jgi:hypothetical protein
MKSRRLNRKRTPQNPDFPKPCWNGKHFGMSLKKEECLSKVSYAFLKNTKTDLPSSRVQSIKFQTGDS